VAAGANKECREQAVFINQGENIMADMPKSANEPSASKGIQGDGTELKGTYDSPGTHVPLDRTPRPIADTLPPAKGGKE
jgi:hypothetical protein